MNKHTQKSLARVGGFRNGVAQNKQCDHHREGQVW